MSSCDSSMVRSSAPETRLVSVTLIIAFHANMKIIPERLCEHCEMNRFGMVFISDSLLLNSFLRPYFHNLNTQNDMTFKGIHPYF